MAWHIFMNLKIISFTTFVMKTLLLKKLLIFRVSWN